MKRNRPSPQKRRRPPTSFKRILLSILLSLLVLGLFGVLSFQIYQQSEILRTLQENLTSLNRKSLRLSDGQNNIRESLGLPTIDLNDTNEALLVDEEELNPNLPFFQGLDALVLRQKREKSLELLQRFRTISQQKIPRIQIETRESGFTLSNESQKVKLLDASLLESTGEILVKGYDQSTFIPEQESGTPAIEIQNQYSDYLTALVTKYSSDKQKYERLRGEFEKWSSSFLENAQIKPFNLRWERASLFNGWRWTLLRSDKSVISQVELLQGEGVQFFFMGKSYSDLSSLTADLESGVTSEDLRPLKVGEFLFRKEYLENLFQSESFRLYVEQNGLSISPTPQQDGNSLYYNFSNQAGEVVGSFAILLATNEIYIMDQERQPIRSIKSFSPDSQLHLEGEERESAANDLPLASQSDEKIDLNDFYLLLVGKNSENTDTIIVGHLKRGEGVALLSVPRDIFLNKWRINTAYKYYGIEALKERLSQMLGVSLRRHIVVDMFAFIDIINQLGGIDVTLKEPLIDPTYRIREGGEWKTLSYPAGTHHLDGRSALRIARSRHTSSDFSRSLRQQTILKATQEKIRSNMTPKGVNTFFQIMQNYVETNLTISEAKDIFLFYRNSQILKNQVLSTSNVLFATYSNFLGRPFEEQEILRKDPDISDKGAWILVPKENNWSLIRRFAKNALQL